MLVKWGKKYEVAVEKLDNDHQKLFDIINEIAHILYFAPKNMTALMNNFTKLQDYTIYHFGHEEDILKKYNYPYLKDHKKRHNDLINRLDNMIRQTRYDYFNKEEVISFLEGWLTDHILECDLEYSKFIHNQ